jgi:ATP-binding cassette subfamily B protein
MARRDQGLRQSLPGLRRIFQRLWPYMGRVRGLMATSVVALVIGVLFKLLEPWPLKFIFDRVIAAVPRDR